MTTTRLRRVARVADVTDPAVRDAFAGMPHYQTVTGRDNVDGWDPLSTEGPNRSTWRLTGYELIGKVPGRTVYVWRVQVNEGREEFVAVQHSPRELEVCHATDHQPASERTRNAATEKARELLAEKVADDAAGPCAQCGAPQSSGRHTTDPNRAGHAFVTLSAPDVVEDSAELAGDLVAELEADARTACAAGDSAAPALSAVVRRELAGLPVGSTRGMAVMTTWADAYEAQRAREEDEARTSYAARPIPAAAMRGAAFVAAVLAAPDLPQTLWLCGECYRETSGHLAQCEDGCSQRLDHDGACHPREHDGTQCQRCGQTGRLTSFDVDNLDPEDVAALTARVAETAARIPRQWIVTFTETVTHRATVTMRDVLPDGDDFPDRQAAALLDLARDTLGTDAVQIVTSSAAFVMADPTDGEAPVLAHERERYEA